MELVAHENCKRKDPGRGRVISERGCAREWDCGLVIARNRMGSIFRPTKGYWKWSREKIAGGAISRGYGLLSSMDERANVIAVSESREFVRGAYLVQIEVIVRGRA